MCPIDLQLRAIRTQRDINEPKCRTKTYLCVCSILLGTFRQVTLMYPNNSEKKNKEPVFLTWHVYGDSTFPSRYNQNKITMLHTTVKCTPASKVKRTQAYTSTNIPWIHKVPNVNVVQKACMQDILASYLVLPARYHSMIYCVFFAHTIGLEKAS